MYHIVVNPTAGKNRTPDVLEKVKAAFAAKGAAYTVHEAVEYGSIRKTVAELTKEKAEGERVKIVVIGGDGTMHEALCGVSDFSCVEMGLVPAGTGNDFAAALGIPEDIDGAMEIILKCETKDTDYLEIGGVRCMNVGGLGIDVDVLARYEKCKKRNKLTYYKCLLKSIFKYKGDEIEVETSQGTKTYHAFIAAACNGRQIGGGIPICPTADVADGKADVVVVKFVKGLKKIKALSMLMKGKILEHPAAEHVLADWVKVKTKASCTVQLDGELYEDLPFDVKVGSGLKFYR